MAPEVVFPGSTPQSDYAIEEAAEDFLARDGMSGNLLYGFEQFILQNAQRG